MSPTPNFITIRLMGAAMPYGRKNGRTDVTMRFSPITRKEPTNLNVFPAGIKRPERETHNST